MQVPFIDVNRFEIEIIETERKTRVTSAENDQHKSFVVPRGALIIVFLFIDKLVLFTNMIF